MSAVRCQAPGDSGAQSAGCAGNDGYLAGQRPAADCEGNRLAKDMTI